MQGVGGVIVATINILLLAVGGDPVDAAFYCFLFSVLFLLGSVLALLHLKRTPLYRQCVLTRLELETKFHTMVHNHEEGPY